MRAPTLTAFVLTGLGLIACGGGDGDDVGDDVPVPRATWYQDVGPIVASTAWAVTRKAGSRRSR